MMLVVDSDFGGRRPRVIYRWLCVLSIVVAHVLLSGCVTLIVPPETPEEPTAVFILDHGRHSSLALPDEQGGLVRYSYGDWQYYAMRETGLRRAMAAIGRPTAAAFGRRELPGPAEPAAIQDQMSVLVEEVHRVVVPADAVRRLRATLDAQFDAARDTLHYSEELDLEFVRHPDAYNLIHNSNHVVAEWLRTLGCDVRGRPVLARWRVQEQS